jgi:putative endonuclease
MSNTYNNVLYIGITSDLYRRITEHKSKEIKGFTQKYNCDKLVYFEEFENIEDAINREKQLKNWKREWKNKLIEAMNPEWKDLTFNLNFENEGD